MQRHRDGPAGVFAFFALPFARLGTNANFRGGGVGDGSRDGGSLQRKEELTAIRDQLEIYGWIAAIPFGTATRATDTCCPKSSSTTDCEAGTTL